MRSTQPEPGRILVVEDEPALLRALEINLRARGYQVACSSRGEAALAEAVRRPPTPCCSTWACRTSTAPK